MGTQEWLLLGVVLLVPLVIAIGVTLWTLEQAIKRNRKNRPDRAARRVSEPVADPAPAAVGASTLGGRDELNHPAVEHAPVEPVATATPDAPEGGGFSGESSPASDGGSSSD